jgi:carboxyl-terminal processing protease
MSSFPNTWRTGTTRALSLFALVGFVAATPHSVWGQQGAEATAKVFQRVVEALEQHGIKLDQKAAQRAAIDAVVKTADPNGAIVPIEEIDRWEQERAGEFYGIGVSLTMTNGRPRVLALQAEGPAGASGIEVDDIIIRVDDDATEATDIVSVTRLLRGSEKRTLTVSVLKPTGETNVVELTTTLLGVPGLESAEVFPTGLCYARLNGLHPGVGEELLQHINKWREAEHSGLILDLRRANGTDIASAAALSSLFAEESMMLFAFRDADDQDLEVFKAQPTEPLGMPAMVLIDEDTSGSAEVLAASLKRSIRGAMLLGSATRGDPAIREFVEFTPEEKLYVATKRLVTADGTLYLGARGVEPDVNVVPRAIPEPNVAAGLILTPREKLDEEVEDILLGERVKGDAVLRRAVDILLGLKALNIRGFQRSTSSAR